MKKFGSLLCLFCLLFITSVSAIVEPMDNTWVHDYADIISEDAEDIINQRIDRLNDGAQIAVVTVDFLDGYNIEDYALKLFNSWGIGGSENNGVLILVSMGEEEYYYLQGQGLERTLPSSKLGQICDDYLVEDLISGEFDSAFINTVDEISNHLDKLYSGSSNSSSSSAHTTVHTSNDAEIFVMLFMMLLTLMFFVMIANAFRPHYGSGYYRPFIFFGPRRPRIPRPVVHHYHHPHHHVNHGPRPNRSYSNSFSSSRPSRPSSFSGGGRSFGGGGGRSFGGGHSRGGGGGGGFGKR